MPVVSTNSTQSPFKTPRSHATLPWEKHRFRIVKWAGRKIRVSKFGERLVSLQRGFSWAKWWCTALSSVPNARSQEAQVRLWCESSTRLPRGEDLLDLTNGFPADTAVRLYVSRAGCFRFYILSDAAPGLPHLFAKRKVHLSARRRVVTHDLVRIVKVSGVPGTNGAQVMANAVKVYRTMGIQSIHLQAGLSAGGAVWPKFGFVPISLREWRKVGETVRANLKNVPEPYKAGFSARTGGMLSVAVEKILNTRDPDNILLLHSLDSSPAGQSAQALVFQNGRLGGFLLQKSRWKGVLDLTNPEIMSYFDDYIGRKRQAGQVI